MALQSAFYNTDGSTRTFPSSKHIPTKQHVAVYLQKVVDSTWVLSDVNSFELIWNSIVLDTAPDVAVYSQVEVRVADAQSELVDAPSNISIVASISSEIQTVSTIKPEMQTLAAISAKISSLYADKTTLDSLYADKVVLNSLYADIAKLESIYADKAKLDSIYADKIPLDAIYANLAEILLADDNAVIATAKASEASTHASSAQLRAWEAEAEELSAQSNAREAENVLTKTYTSNGNGTFSVVDNAWYSALHYRNKALISAVSAERTGQIIHFAGTTPPTGYLACDGSEVSQAVYADLFAAIGTAWNTTGGAAAPAAGNFRLPPSAIGGLGLYMRGVGATNGAVGTYQVDVHKEHNHTGSADSGGEHTHTFSMFSGDTGNNFKPTEGAGTISNNGTTNSSGAHTHTLTINNTGDATETRPRSITVLMCIKY